mgnify:FL=1|tara:strand:- start:137 stop:541 length:405 start_codon:yes stop_codon:yes gene_type:complete
MINPINMSGIKLEENLELFLKSNDFPYRKQKSGASEIDFIIPTKENKIIYADCTNQNTGGSVEEKIPHKVWKYWKKYNYKEVYIIRGDYTIGKTVIKHLKDEEKTRGYKTHILTLEEFCNFLQGKQTIGLLEFT